MPRSFFSTIALAGLAALAVAAVVAAGLLWQSASTKVVLHRSVASDQAEGYRERARVKIRDHCNRIGVEAVKVDCVAQANEASNEGYRNERELESQQIVAVWTEHMGIAAIAGMAASIVGAGLIWFTFFETRRANQIAARQQRAWLVAQLKVVDHEFGLGHSVGLAVENVGSTVATNVVVSCELAHEPPGAPLGSDLVSHRHTVRAGESIPVFVSIPTDGEFDNAYIAGVILYHTVFGGPHRAHFCLRIEQMPARIGISGPSRAGISEIPSYWPADT